MKTASKTLSQVLVLLELRQKECHVHNSLIDEVRQNNYHKHNTLQLG